VATLGQESRCAFVPVDFRVHRLANFTPAAPVWLNGEPAPTPAKHADTAHKAFCDVRAGRFFAAAIGSAPASNCYLTKLIASRRISLSRREGFHRGASLEVLAQSIEAVGSMDREAIAAHFRDRKFKTFLGELSMPGQIIDKVYTVGQWRGGFFKAVAGVGFSDYAQVNLKTSWG
jgi:hypothetical protein